MVCRVEGCKEVSKYKIKMEFQNNVVIGGLCEQHYLEYDKTDATKVTIEYMPDVCMY
jgi:hypothetical protein